MGCALILSWSAISVWAQVAPAPATKEIKAPPTALAPVVRPASDAPDEVPFAAAAPGPYSIGEPTDEEQLYLEYLNRARANPPAEGLRLAFTTDPDVRSSMTFFGVDTNLLLAAFNAIAPAPPLAFNAQLITAARLHSLDMFTNAFQDHVGSDGRTLGQRATAAGYAWSQLAENIYSYADSVGHGHAGFEVDWGPGPGGMQSPPGHRISIHNPAFREVGIGVVLGVNTVAGETVGPQVVTQDFGNGFGARPFLSGVVYYDLNGNGLYDAGEGLRGVRVDVSGIQTYALSAGSGGYTVPVSNGTRTVTFSGSGLPPTTRTVSFVNNTNVKTDLALAYVAPVLSGPANISVNSSNRYSFSAVPGVLSYELSSYQLQPYTLVDGAETGIANFLVAISAGYDPVATDVRSSGTQSFHLAMPEFEDQSLTLTRVLRPSANAAWVFASRLGYATVAQTARAQVSADGGRTWTDVWSRAGTGNAGQTAFARVTNSLAAFAGREIACRFLYDYAGGSVFTQTSTGFGWYLDDIAFVNTEEVVGETAQTITSGTNVVFMPAVPGSHVLRVRPRLGNAFGPYGPALTVVAGPEAPVLRITRIESPGAGQIRIDFQVVSGVAGMLALERKISFTDAWSLDGGAVLTTLTPGSVYRFTTSSSGVAQRFYRVRSQ